MDDDTEISRARFRRTFLVILALAITLLFLWMIRDFLLALLLAALAAAMSYRPYKRLLTRFGGRKNLAAGVTLTLLLLLVIVPLVAFISVVLSQAVEVSKAVTPWVREQLNQGPGRDRGRPDIRIFGRKAGFVVNALGRYSVFNSLPDRCNFRQCDL